LKLAAIDIGSNAARLLITEPIDYKQATDFNKINLVRVPLRLGFDVFEYGEIKEDKIEMLLNTLKAFKYLLDAYKVKHFIACATSAMRDASNAEEIIKRVKWETGISIEVISGDKEAFLVYENHVAEHLDKNKSYLYVDVGGGSTECSVFDNGTLVFKKSFNIGTIRILKKMVTSAEWDDMKISLQSATKSLKKIVAIGSGGNINKVFSLSKLKDGKPLSYTVLKNYYKEMEPLSVSERMHQYKFKEDRADVIVPAMEIYINVMKWTNAEEIFVPKIGLADGLIHHLYESLQK
jgi:exopolyphosphatase / guanosine-5'-triphosphate,3'-diphosphate pyrophosphatase